jgi:NADPH:quinone reductase-like Zn-dependent oxidoreductase
MKAIVYHTYGPPDVLKFDEAGKPAPEDDEVLIRVRAASVNPVDWHFMRGAPYPFRMVSGLRKPKVTVLGVDVAGQVEAVGKGVREFKPGDEVFGACRGAFAEYVCTAETAVVKKAANVSFDQAASAPIATFTALQSLRDNGHVQPGQKVLINGAAGGVGTFAVQIAKWLGVEVTGVCSARNVEMVRSLGADRVIDYTQEDFTRSPERYDLILDCVGNHSFSECRRVLKPKGICILIGGGPPDAGSIGPLAQLMSAIVSSWFASQKFMMFMAKWRKEDLATMNELISTGKVIPVIDRRYRLKEVPEAIRYLEQGHARGKVVIDLSDAG